MSAAFTGVDGKPQIPGRGTAPRYPSRGERSVLNGKPVVADGKGNWLDGSKPMTPMSERSTVGNYNPGLRFPSVEKIKKGEYGTKPQNPAAPAKPAVKPSASLSIPPSAAQPGTGPKGNQTGDPPSSGSKDQRVNANGLVSYGKDLSSLNAFTKDFTGGYELTDIKSAFQSNDLQGAYQNGSNTISTEDSKYTLNDSATPSNVGGKYTMDGVDTSMPTTGYKIDGGSVPGTVGGNPADPQDGTSDKPDVAERIRQVRMARSEGSPRGFNGADFSGAEPDDSSLVSPMYANAKRNKIRDTFLDLNMSSVQASVAANAVAGRGSDSDGRSVFNYGGELVYAKDGMEQKANNAANMGQNPSQFLDIPATPDTQPDTPAASELSPSFAKETPGAQEFFKTELKKVKDKNK